ncbi:hypothetical protein F511_41036 [Dorcoceras hygrometricum]|uniref:Uncharacterized protein n=1 Tax=Dorcoceras hygrometricum TaxID=472368 RepID=A0A2Z7CVB4_9LAMI|nr:hypothetical protein F511_41036 [Dorcoceras hygrometricum]
MSTASLLCSSTATDSSHCLFSCRQIRYHIAHQLFTQLSSSSLTTVCSAVVFFVTAHQLFVLIHIEQRLIGLLFVVPTADYSIIDIPTAD